VRCWHLSANLFLARHKRRVEYLRDPIDVRLGLDCGRESLANALSRGKLQSL
jgi:hypothetical protein